MIVACYINNNSTRCENERKSNFQLSTITYSGMHCKRLVNPPRHDIYKQSYLTSQYGDIMIKFDALQMQRESSIGQNLQPFTDNSDVSI